ncbi:unnamed protein product [Mytilus coruscus]|uniref:Ig-like domain-containing protein n=1 Tax=Mytilus coruscus TaxID=42192 RepID=A0A6J8C7L7_MYTCO|nr:unnamed protein product [Mytilus coruscus]
MAKSSDTYQISYFYRVCNIKISILVIGKPKVSILNPSNQCSKLGSVGSLVVKYLSWPPPLNLTWFKYEDNQNIKLQASENYTMIDSAVIIDYCHDRKIHVDGYIGILHINEVTLKDFTNYTVDVQIESSVLDSIIVGLLMGVCVTVDNGIEDNCKKPEIVQRDVEHGVYYDGDEVKVRNLSSTPESIYNEVNPRADEKIETSNCPPPSLSHETDRESKPLIPFRRTDDNSDFKRRRQPQVPSSSSDIYCSDDLDDTDRGPTPLFLNRRPGEETDVKMGRPTHPTIHRTDISFGNNECGSQSSNAEHVQMSSSPYASYGYKTNEASDRTLQPTRIRPDKQDCDLYGSHTNVNDSWNQPFIPDKKIEIDNDETFKMERDTKEDEN